MKNIVIVLLVLFNVACTAQSQKQESINKSKPQPDISWKVDKQVDENGNIIRYDSTYTWSYSSSGGSVNMDSLMREYGFNPRQNFYTPSWNHTFPLPNDSFFNYRSYFNDMHKQMDDWMRHFFDDPFLDNYLPQHYKRKEQEPAKKSSNTNWY